MKRVLAVAILLLFGCWNEPARAAADTGFREILIHQSDLPAGYGHPYYQLLQADAGAYIMFSAGSLIAEQRSIVGYSLSFSITRFASHALAVQMLHETATPAAQTGGQAWQLAVGDPADAIGSISSDPTLPDPAAAKEIVGTRYRISFVRGPFLLTENVLGRTGTMDPTTIAGYAYLMDSRVLAYIATTSAHTPDRAAPGTDKGHKA
jgi:hypothetical protein